MKGMQCWAEYCKFNVNGKCSSEHILVGTTGECLSARKRTNKLALLGDVFIPERGVR